MPSHVTPVNLEISVAGLASLPARGYIDQVRARLSDDDLWVILLEPVLADRTRWALGRLEESLVRQLETIPIQQNLPPTDSWLRSTRRLLALVRKRARLMALEESSKEGGASPTAARQSKVWRALSARLARELVARGQGDVLHTIRAPFGDMSVAEWLIERERKNGK